MNKFAQNQPPETTQYQKLYFTIEGVVFSVLERLNLFRKDDPSNRSNLSNLPDNTSMFRQPKQSTPLTTISSGSEFQGSLHVEGNLEVSGIIHGTVEVRGDMIVQANGLIEGPEIRARNLMIHGVVKSRITVEGKLILTRTARLEGDVTARALDIEPGANYIGYIETKEVASLPASNNLLELVGREQQEA